MILKFSDIMEKIASMVKGYNGVTMIIKKEKLVGNMRAIKIEDETVNTVIIPIRHDVSDSKTYGVELSEKNLKKNSSSLVTGAWVIASLAEILSTTTKTDIKEIKEQIKTNYRTPLIDPYGIAENIEKKVEQYIEEIVDAVLPKGIPEDRKITQQMIERANIEDIVSPNSYIIARYTGKESLAEYIASLCQGNQLDKAHSDPLDHAMSQSYPCSIL